jgi:hypothetical protein
MTKEEIAARISQIAFELSDRARTHPIGRLQDIRTRLKGLGRRPASTIFTSQSIIDDYAFHLGGRTELQFNIGAEEHERGLELRHGVAFSLQASRSFPDIAPLEPKVRLFNEYMELYPDLFTDMTMWHYQGDDFLGDRPTGPIPEDLVRLGMFIVLGKRQPFDNVDLEVILDDFDRLLPLYKFVESGGTVEPLATPEAEFKFEPGFVERRSSAVVSRVPRELNVSLRHTLIQKALYERLADKFGAENVRAEQASGVGTFVDAVVQRPGDVYWFYEIKTSASPRACIREALGQLLEYSNWPGSPNVERLIVVGESVLDWPAAEYLKRLQARFNLPIEYEQCVSAGEDG